jgi:hypothetical protein
VDGCDQFDFFCWPWLFRRKYFLTCGKRYIFRCFLLFLNSFSVLVPGLRFIAGVAPRDDKDYEAYPMKGTHQ